MDREQIGVEISLRDYGSVKAFADVTLPSNLGEITVRRFRVIQQEGRAPWVGFPTASYLKDGEYRNPQLLELPYRLRSAIAQRVLAEFERAQNSA